MIPRVHVGQVRLPFAAFRTVVESVGIRVKRDQGKLAVDYPSEHVLEFLVLISKLNIRPDLCSGVPQPHGVDVSRIDESPPVSVLVFAEMDGGVQGVWVAIGEHPGQTGIFQSFPHLVDLVLDSCGFEKPLVRGGTFGFVIHCLGCASAKHHDACDQNE